MAQVVKADEFFRPMPTIFVLNITDGSQLQAGHADRGTMSDGLSAYFSE